MDYLKGLDPGSQVNYKDILVTNGKMWLTVEAMSNILIGANVVKCYNIVIMKENLIKSTY